MTYKGFKTSVRCIDWEQINTLDRYLSIFTSHISPEKVIGLGMNWRDDYFDYAVGVIDDEETLQKMKDIDFSNTSFSVKYIEMNLPDYAEWNTFKGRKEDLKKLYEEYIDCYRKPYDYELEYIDDKGNLEIKIHYI